MVRGDGMTDGSVAFNVINSMSTALFHVKDDGKIGVGTTSPGARFMVSGFGNDETSAALNVVNSDGNSALLVRDNGRVGVGVTMPGAKFMVRGDGNTNASVAFNVINNMSTSLFHIKDDGFVGIGTTSPTEMLEVNGNVKADNVMVPSDRRYKTQITTLSTALSLIGQLRGTSYYLLDQDKSQDLQIGFIAQEIEAVLPSLVHTDKEGYKSVNYIAVIPLLTEALKTQQTQIDRQNQAIEKQEARLQQLEQELTEIKALLGH